MLKSRVIIIIILISSPGVFGCSNDYIDPDGENVFFYEECLHMNRGKFTDDLHQKCKKYSNEQMIKHNMIWETYARSCTGLFDRKILIKKRNFTVF